MVEPKLLCRQHLLGEHRELHTFAGTLRKHISVSGYMNLGELDPTKLASRHEELVTEMERRGYCHFSPLEVPNYSYVTEKACIDVEANLRDLFSRCSECHTLQTIAADIEGRIYVLTHPELL